MALPVTLVTLGGVPVQLVDQTGSVFPTTGTGSLVFNTTPTLVTPILGAATGTSLALGGATIGSNALAVTGTVLFNGTVLPSGSTVNLGNSSTRFGGIFAQSVGLSGFAPTDGGFAGGFMALGGATIGSNALAVTGTANFSGAISAAGYTNTGSFSAGATSQYGFTGRGAIQAPATNGLKLTDNAGTGGQFLESVEMTAPSAPAANGYRIFAQDNGGGKTQLMVIFGSGLAQQIAIEP